MVNLKVLVVVCAMIISVFGLGETTVNIVPQPEITTVHPSNSTTTAPPSTTNAPPSNSTTAAPPTNSTTAAPPTNSTTAAPPTTSTIPTTPKITTVTPNITTTTTTTTVKPTTSTPTPPTPKPTPTPDPTVINWTVNYNNSNNSCIFIQVAMQYVISVPNSNETVTINVPGKTQATGSCEGESKQNLKVTWDQNNELDFDFGKTNASKFELDNLTSTLNVTLKSGPKIFNFIHKSPEFPTPLANSYKCARVQTLNCTEANSNVTALLHISHLQYQAFRNTSVHKFDTALDCEGSSTPDVVPIVVGCVLAALVIMVLIAYLVGRRRCQARGYLSM